MSGHLPSVAESASMAEIAQALGLTKQAAQGRANKEAWPYETVGTRRLYPLATLPVDVRKALKHHRSVAVMASRGARMKALTAMLARFEEEQEAAASVRQERGEAALRDLANLSERESVFLNARCAIAQGWQVWFASARPPIRKSASWAPYAHAYNLGEIPVAKAVREAYPDVSGRSVQRWVGAYQRSNLGALIDRRNGDARRGQTAFSAAPLLAAAAKKILLDRPGVSTVHLHELLKTAAIDASTGELLFTPPSYDQVLRFQKAWIAEHRELYLQATNPDAWKNQCLLAYGSASEEVTALNQRWEMDATPADWLLIDVDGKKKRFTVSVIVDVYSRRALVVVARTPKAQTHCYALRLALLAWGVPAEVVTDNGADYQGEHFTRVLAALAIAHRATAPFSPEQKPHIERFIGTLNHSILELLPNFAGHNVAERQALRARQSFAERLARKGEIVDFADVVDGSCTGEFLQARINDWLAGVYEQREHGGLGTRPFQRAAGWSGAVRRIGDERALDTLLARPAGNNGRRTLQKKGILLDGAWFISPEVARIDVGSVVDVFETEDLGRIIVHHDGEFVGVAQCPERTGVSRADIARLAAAEQAERLKAGRARIKEETRGQPDTDELVIRHLHQRAAAAGKLATAAFGDAGGTTHSSHGLEQAQRANRVLDGAPAVARTMVLGGRVTPAVPLPKAEVLPMPTPERKPRSERAAAENHAEWCELAAKQAAGEPLSAIDARFVVSWPTSNQGRAYLKIADLRQAG